MELQIHQTLLNRRTCLYLAILFSLFSCKGKDETIPKATIPTNLVYSPAVLELKSGVAGSSSLPSIKGTGLINYTITTSPSSTAITIESDGTIKANSSLGIGEYNVTVLAVNSAGSATFSNAYKIKVTENPVLPSTLTYTPNNLTMETGEAKSSVIPTISGSKPVTFTVTSSPASQQLSIDNTGKISVAKEIPVGTYTLSVVAKNAVGTAEFKNVYTITITTSKGPTGLTYSPNSLTLIQGSAGTSATPAITSATPITYTISTIPATNDITINDQGIISSNSNLAEGSYAISVAAVNADGSRVFSNAYSIKVNSATPSVTFNGDVKAIIQNNCSPCHTTGDRAKYNQFANAKSGIDAILDRIQRTQGSAGMMPQNGTKLSADQINLIKKWKDDGLKE